MCATHPAPTRSRPRRRRLVLAACALFLAIPAVLAAGAQAEQASSPMSAAAAGLDVGKYSACATLAGGQVRCWGFNGDGQLGYGNTQQVGDDETPASAGPIDLGANRTAKAFSAGDSHTCALLDDNTVRCWGFNNDGQLGYGNRATVGDDETPGSVGAVRVGPDRTAKAIAAGGGHTCAVLDDGNVRCWGFGNSGQLGYGNSQPNVLNNVGDDETPDTATPVRLGVNRTATAITAGLRHTCALLDNGNVRCWGVGLNGQIGTGSTATVGDFETPDTVPPVDLGPGRTATAIAAGDDHTCALLDDKTVRCWGFGGNGELGYGDRQTIGNNETPGTVGPVDLGAGYQATAITAASQHTCALLADGSVRCWGLGANGRLGYGNTNSIGATELPSSVGPVDLGAGRSAVAISAGGAQTCARLDDGSVRCWGAGANGRLGYCDERDVGDDELPGAVGPVNLVAGDGGAGCVPRRPGDQPPTGGAITAAAQSAAALPSPALAAAARARGLRGCLAGVASHAKREQSLARRGSARTRARLRRHRAAHQRQGRRRCLRLYARTPGRVMNLKATTIGRTQLELTFTAPGSDNTQPPPARSYLIKQSRRPIRSARDFARAQTLCKGACRFTVTSVGANLSLRVTDLRPRTTYHYAIVARDAISAKRGPRSASVSGKTR